MRRAGYPWRAAVALLWAVLLGVRTSHAGTLATFVTSVGTMELKLYDEDRPVTVSNFIKYVTSGRFDTNDFIQRWAPGFVIQAGGFKVTNSAAGLKVTRIQSFGTITNEYSVGTNRFSNTYGTIAMARGSETNSAGSEWFLNLTNNAFLDKVTGGFTVFGELVAGTNVLNLFVPPPPTNNIYGVNLGITPATDATPTIGNPGTLDELFKDLIYIDIKLRRDVALTISPTRPGQRVISWTTVTGVTNTLESTSALNPGIWTAVTNIVGNGATRGVLDTSADSEKIYRVTLTY